MIFEPFIIINSPALNLENKFKIKKNYFRRLELNFTAKTVFVKFVHGFSKPLRQHTP